MWRIQKCRRSHGRNCRDVRCGLPSDLDAHPAASVGVRKRYKSTPVTVCTDSVRAVE
jgi:hypothetical protein